MLGFLLSLLIPIKIAAAAVLIYLFLKLAMAAETPNSKLLTPNIKVDEVQSWWRTGRAGNSCDKIRTMLGYPQEFGRKGWDVMNLMI